MAKCMKYNFYCFEEFEKFKKVYTSLKLRLIAYQSVQTLFLSKN